MEKADTLDIQERQTPVTRGVLVELPTLRHLKIRQFAPTEPARLPWLEHVWSVEWDLPKGMSHRQRTVPFPAFNLVADARTGPALFGCTSCCFEYPLTGAGHVVGIRFKPAFQGAFYTARAADLTDSSLGAEQIFGPELVAQLAHLAAQRPPLGALAEALVQLRDQAGALSDSAHLVNHMVRYIETHPTVFRVADVAKAFARSDRTLQRSFQRHLGMSPKAVIERFRLQNALQLSQGHDAGFAELAQRLGYFDQAHFIGAFRRIVGTSPADFAKQRAAAETSTLASQG